MIMGGSSVERYSFYFIHATTENPCQGRKDIPGVASTITNPPFLAIFIRRLIQKLYHFP
jgi:hypothetical protein